MTDRQLVRGDAYVIAEPVFILTLLDRNMGPYDMTGSTVRSTFRSGPIDPSLDPDDSNADMRCVISFDESGEVVGTPIGFKLPDGMTASDGILELTAGITETMALEAGKTLGSDVQVTDANGEPHTIFSVWTITARDGYTSAS